MKTGLLIAEADEELRGLFDQIANQLGFDVETAADGLECWSKLRARVPDVLVVDVEIPWGGGDGVLARLREDGEGATTPTVFVMGNDRPDVLATRAGISCGRCFQKPFRLTELLDSVRAVIPGSRQLESHTA